MNNIKVWKEGEKQVADYMKKIGYKIVYTNFFCKVAELDIVAILPKKVQKRSILNENKAKIKDLNDKLKIKLLKMNVKNQLKNLKDTLVIVEVKARSNKKFGMGLDAVDNEKVRHLERGGEYLLKMERFKNMQIRYDIASVDEGKITYIENAL